MSDDTSPVGANPQPFALGRLYAALRHAEIAFCRAATAAEGFAATAAGDDSCKALKLTGLVEEIECTANRIRRLADERNDGVSP